MKFSVDSYSWCNYGHLCTTVAHLLALMTAVLTPPTTTTLLDNCKFLPCAVAMWEACFLKVKRWVQMIRAETTKCSGVAGCFITSITLVLSLDWTVRSVNCALHRAAPLMLVRPDCSVCECVVPPHFAWFQSNKEITFGNPPRTSLSHIHTHPV